MYLPTVKQKSNVTIKFSRRRRGRRGRGGGRGERSKRGERGKRGDLICFLWGGMFSVLRDPSSFFFLLSLFIFIKFVFFKI